MPELVSGCTVPLMAGQHQWVGEVSITSTDGVHLAATYRITDGYSRLRATHFYAGLQPPAKSAPGQFPFRHTQLNAATDQYLIPLASLGASSISCLYFAVHAEVDAVSGFQPADLDWFAAGLPDTGYMSVSYPGGGDSYLDALVWGAGDLDGSYDNWCVDTDHEIYPGEPYRVEVYSSYEALPPGLIDAPENLDLVNFILHADLIGQLSSTGEPFTFGDVQRALWLLVEDVAVSEGIDPWDPVRVDEILNLARAQGEGFIPPCAGLVAVILNPIDEQNNTIAQVTIVEAPFRCPPILKRETAWGAGSFRFRTGWGSYFRCCPGQP